MKSSVWYKRLDFFPSVSPISSTSSLLSSSPPPYLCLSLFFFTDKMLRVYSVLYIERLWSDDPTVSSQKNLIQSSNSSTHSQIIVTDAYATRDIQADDIADVASVQNSDEEQEGSSMAR